MGGQHFLWIVAALSSVWANDEPLQMETNATVFDSCFHADPELCVLSVNATRTCVSYCTFSFTMMLSVQLLNCPQECIPHPSAVASLVCCNVTDIEKAMACAPIVTDSTNTSHWQHIHIYNATLDMLDISKNHFKRLQSLAITDGLIKGIVNEFTRFSEPRCLNFSNNNLSEINVRAFTHLVQLQVLDISTNNLSTIPNISGRNMTLDIRGNKKMLCKSVLESIDRFKFVDPDSTFCLTNNSFNWFNSTDSIPLRQLELINSVSLLLFFKNWVTVHSSHC
jgi:Leucine rich repeat